MSRESTCDFHRRPPGRHPRTRLAAAPPAGPPHPAPPTANTATPPGRARSVGDGPASPKTRRRRGCVACVAPTGLAPTGLEAFEGFDGKTLYFIKSRHQHSVWQVPVEGGRETVALDGVTEGNWGVSSQGIFYLQGPSIRHWAPRSNADRLVYTISGHRPLEVGFGVSEDGKKFLWTQVDRHEADILTGSITQQ